MKERGEKKKKQEKKLFRPSRRVGTRLYVIRRRTYFMDIFTFYKGPGVFFFLYIFYYLFKYNFVSDATSRASSPQQIWLSETRGTAIHTGRHSVPPRPNPFIIIFYVLPFPPASRLPFTRSAYRFFIITIYYDAIFLYIFFNFFFSAVACI